MPLERAYLSMVEKALGEDIKLEEFETLFVDDPSKKTSLMQKGRQDGGANGSHSAPGQQDVRCYLANHFVSILLLNGRWTQHHAVCLVLCLGLRAAQQEEQARQQQQQQQQRTGWHWRSW